MGKSILKISRWSIRSIVILYGKAATLFFALICVLSGLTARSVAAGTSSVTARTYKGKVLFSSDSEFVKNVKLYLYSVAYPVYGMTAGPLYTKVDSTTSDSNGNFNFSTSRELDKFLLTSADKIKHNSSAAFIFTTPEVNYLSNNDTSFTLYMYPTINSSVKQSIKCAADYKHSVIAGGIVSIAIPEWNNSSLRAIVFNSLGEKVTSVESHEPGAIRWNTANVAKGCYIVQISNGSGTVAMNVAVK